MKLLALVGLLVSSVSAVGNQPAVTAKPASLAWVELSGTVGKSILAPGIDAVCIGAIREGATELALVVDSADGSVRDARAIAEVLQKHRPKLKFHVVIRRTMNAGVYLQACADHIWVCDGATSGPAGAATPSPFGGDKEIDLQTNSSIGAELAALAQSRGQSPAIYRAMTVMADVCYVHQVTDGYEIDSQRERNGTPGRQLDGPQSLLTLTGAEMIDLKLASPAGACDTDLADRIAKARNLVSLPTSKFNAAKILRSNVDRLAQLQRIADDAEKKLADTEAKYNRLLGEWEQQHATFQRAVDVDRIWNNRTSARQGSAAVEKLGNYLNSLRRTIAEHKTDVISLDTANHAVSGFRRVAAPAAATNLDVDENVLHRAEDDAIRWRDYFRTVVKERAQ